MSDAIDSYLILPYMENVLHNAVFNHSMGKSVTISQVHIEFGSYSVHIDQIYLTFHVSL